MNALSKVSPRIHPRPPRVRASAGRSLSRRYAWWIVGVALVVFSAGLVLWAGTRPGYDPYGWLVWGHQTLRLSLDLGGAPSWKPLPYLFTLPYSFFGHYALWLWMVTCVAGSLAGSVFAARLAYRLTGAGREHRYAAIIAGVFAGVALLGIDDYAHYVLSVQSDPLIVTACLAAIDCHLSRHYRWAFALGVLASLGRPEAWPFLGLYAIWAWRTIPSMRWFLYAGLSLVPLLWFGVPTITNHRPLVAGQLAQLSPREVHGNKITGTIGRIRGLTYLPLQLAALLALVWAFVRRDRLVLILALGSAVWVIVEIAFALHGWPAVPRYLFAPAGVMVVLAGVAVGWLLQGIAEIRRVPSWAGLPVIAVLVASLVPGALARVRTEHKDLRHERARTYEINRLQTTINRLGGYKHIRDCGKPVTNVEYVSILAWFVKLDVGPVGHLPDFERHQTYPIVLFTPLRHGWSVLPWHTAPGKRAACASLKASFVTNARHPRGVLVRSTRRSRPG